MSQTMTKENNHHITGFILDVKDKEQALSQWENILSCFSTFSERFIDKPGSYTVVLTVQRVPEVPDLYRVKDD